MATGGVAANWETKSLSNTVILWTTRVTLPIGISFRPAALAGCMSVTDDVHTDRQMEGPRCGNRCCNSQNRFQRWRLKLMTLFYFYYKAFYTRWVKKGRHRTLVHIFIKFSLILTFFFGTLSRKFAIKRSSKISTNFKCITTLPCEILIPLNERDLYTGAVFAEIDRDMTYWQAATIVTEASHSSRFHWFYPGSGEHQTGVVKFPHADCHHQRLTEHRSCAKKKTFCSDVFLIYCCGWV